MRKSLKKYFVPHRGNDYKPHFFRAMAVLVSGIALGGTFFLFTLVLKSLPDSPSFAAIFTSVLVSETNDARKTLGGTELVENELLKQAAQLKANDMAAQGYFSHNSPDGKTPWYWLNQVGYTYKYAGENLAVNFVDSKDVTEAWMSSPGHRSNILNEKLKEVGIATAEGVYKGQPTIFVVQFFGTPADKAVISTTPIHPEEEASVVVQGVEEVRVAGVYTDTNSALDKIISSPKNSMKSIYYVLALAVLILMLGASIYEWKKHHKSIWLGGGALLLVLALLILFTMGLNQGTV